MRIVLGFKTEMKELISQLATMEWDGVENGLEDSRRVHMRVAMFVLDYYKQIANSEINRKWLDPDMDVVEQLRLVLEGDSCGGYEIDSSSLSNVHMLYVDIVKYVNIGLMASRKAPDIWVSRLEDAVVDLIHKQIERNSLNDIKDRLAEIADRK
jgi:hypothetical protein